MGVQEEANRQDHSKMVSVAVQVVVKGQGKGGIVGVARQNGEVWHKNGTGARTDVVLEASDSVGPEPGEVDTNERGVAVEGEIVMIVEITIVSINPPEAVVNVESSVEMIAGTTGSKELSLDDKLAGAGEDCKTSVDETT